MCSLRSLIIPVIGSIQQTKPPLIGTAMNPISDKPSLKETEDKISKWFQDQKEAERESMKALVYRILYNEGLRINRAEEIVRRSFKV